MFHDRQDAGRQLAAALSSFELLDPLVLGIPRGGIVPAAVIADALPAELDVVLAHKLRSPQQPELAFGAVGEDGHVSLNPHACEVVGVTKSYLERERQTQLDEIRRRQLLFRSGRPAAPITGRSVILTDDGIATGSTMFAAIEVIKGQRPHELIVAVPVRPAQHAEAVAAGMRPCRLLVRARPLHGGRVNFMSRYLPVEDQEVVGLLERHRTSAS